MATAARPPLASARATAAPELSWSVSAGGEQVEVLVLLLQAGWNLVLWVAAFGGAIELARRRSWPELLLFATAIGYQTVASFVVAHGRMRVPIVGLLAVLAALGLSQANRPREGAESHAATRV